jgi:hypothetical protein
METTTVEWHEVLRCPNPICRLLQRRAADSHCRRCLCPLDIDERLSVHAPRSRLAIEEREKEIAAILADPFLTEIASLLPMVDMFDRVLIYLAARDMAGKRQTLNLR